MNKITTGFSRAQFPLWQHPLALSHKPKVALLQVPVWERPFPNAGSAQSSGTLRIPCLFLSFSTSPEARRRHQAPNTDGAAAFRQDAAERNTTIDKLLRVDWLEIFDVEPILAEFLRTDALHSKLM